MIRRRPSATVVSLPSAWVLSRVCALASKPVAALNLFALTWAWSSPMACSMSRWAYHTSRSGYPAKARIAVRYPGHASQSAVRVWPSMAGR